MIVKPSQVADILLKNHYLGPSKRGVAWQDEFGVIVVASPTARRLPPRWLELVRWCITSNVKNAGSMQWAAFVRAIRKARPDVTTMVSYSDPSAGHTGALYRACNWVWAPTWHRLRPPPSGNGSWQPGSSQATKDRWVFLLSRDEERASILEIKDESILRKDPWLRFCEPGGVPYRRGMEVIERRQMKVNSPTNQNDSRYQR